MIKNLSSLRVSFQSDKTSLKVAFCYDVFDHVKLSTFKTAGGTVAQQHNAYMGILCLWAEIRGQKSVIVFISITRIFSCFVLTI